jgi:CheY-like chemotaxis protein
MASSKHCFVIMPFSSTSTVHNTLYWDDFFAGFIKPNVEAIGYSCKRSSAEPGNIIKGVINELMNSDIVLAVLTDFNANVWYELGIRHVLKNGTIMMIEREQKLPFDIQQYSVIEYDHKIIAAAKFKADLEKFIQKIESQKPIDNPAMDFLHQYKIDPPSQQNEKDQKVYEDKLEKILQLVQGLQLDRLVTPSESKEIKHTLRNKKILWVDDNPSNNEAIIDIYRLQGVKFDLALNTIQALDAINSNNYDILISDMGRGLDRDAGLKLLQEIKKQIANHPPFFIFASSKAIDIFGESARQEGAAIVTSSIRNLMLKINEVLKMDNDR